VKKGTAIPESLGEYGIYNERAKIAAAICWTTPPPDVSDAVLTWVKRRELVLRGFLLGLEIWGEQYRRVLSCGRLRIDRKNGTMVEITEHDI
jgi:hypothetical protein